MKDTDGYFTVLAWVVEKRYNEGRDGWDYWVMRKDVSQTNWLEGGYWRAETELKKVERLLSYRVASIGQTW